MTYIEVKFGETGGNRYNGLMKHLGVFAIFVGLGAIVAYGQDGGRPIQIRPAPGIQSGPMVTKHPRTQPMTSAAKIKAANEKGFKITSLPDEGPVVLTSTHPSEGDAGRLSFRWMPWIDTNPDSSTMIFDKYNPIPKQLPQIIVNFKPEQLGKPYMVVFTGFNEGNTTLHIGYTAEGLVSSNVDTDMKMGAFNLPIIMVPTHAVQMSAYIKDSTAACIIYDISIQPLQGKG